MRLKSLKLSGFKSFVDSTKFTFPTNLSGIVGPNGCGKSNAIDAVRWVLGERSAKHLRGDSMVDVIFNGAKTRKPVGQASVELIFDNSSGRIQGKFAAYNEIAVRRRVTREGISDYFLNGTKCRRRDIMDLFLGTGLGPRSYAIIEQGMISRLVEAKPDDLRAMIEEAAGISKYKERRRDTENRIRHTKENLSRITDLKEEIEKQIKRLKRQVKAAKKFKELKATERQLKVELLSFKWQIQTEKHEKWQKKIREQEVALEANLAKLEKKNTRLEKINQELIQSQDELGKAQAEFYQASSEISATEQTLSSNKERVAQLTEDLDNLRARLEKNLQTQKSDEATSAELAGWVSTNNPKLEKLSLAFKNTDDTKIKTENKWNDWQSLWNQLQQDVLKSEQTTGFAKAKIEQLESQQSQLLKRKQTIEPELANTPAPGELDKTLLEKLNLAKTGLDKLQTEKSELTLSLKTSRDKFIQTSASIDKIKEEHSQSAGRLESLKLLKNNIIDADDNLFIDWLNANNLNQHKRLFENLNVKSGWERAVHTCLIDFINALCLEDEAKVLNSIADANDFNASFIDINKPGKSQRHIGKTLGSVIDSEYDFDIIFPHIYIADNLKEALALRDKLENGESIVTQDGILLGSNWIRKINPQHEKNNILRIEKNIKAETEKFTNLESELKTRQQSLENLQAEIEGLEQQLEQLHEKISTSHKTSSQLEADKSAEQAKTEQLLARRQHLDKELKEISDLLSTTESEISGTRHDLNSALGSMNKFADEKTNIESQKDTLYSSFLQARQEAETANRQYHALAVEFESRQSRLNELNNHISRISSQHAEEKKQEALLQRRIEGSEAPIREMEDKLQKLLESQTEIEQKLDAAKLKLNNIEFTRQEKADKQRQLEDKILQTRNKLENLRLEAQESTVRAKTLQEELQARKIDPVQHLENLPEDANLNEWRDKIGEIARKIERLGAINLAAIEEYKSESERKEYIDKQFADLTVALETLEDAIRKIDQETKSRFKKTYQDINSGLQKNFPVLFGGGKACLEITSNDLLEAGVNIMAQPPGKRNSTIHLLSGGEKALTAVALVFAIFELNPAPFCMLDEVDAPLDDANVERFCQMVEKMSERIQFIMVTHNKITMELANQLTGVTMQEAGASRMVTVNLDEAAKMADS